MRLIDADALIEEIAKTQDLRTLSTKTVGEAIDRVPSAQKTGRWEKHILKGANVQWGYDCSSCREWFVIGQDYIKRYKHCPNCGAYMRGEEE